MNSAGGLQKTSVSVCAAVGNTNAFQDKKMSVSEGRQRKDPHGVMRSRIVKRELYYRVIEPEVRKAGEPFLANLDAITVEQLCKDAERSRIH